MTTDAKTPDLTAVAWRLRTLWEQSSHGNAPLTFEAAKLGLELHRSLEAAQANLAALRAERDRFVARHEQVLAERNQFELDAIALRERLAVGEADALRLDWMERHHASIWWGGILERREGPDPNAVALEWLDAGDLVNQSERFRTLREAIDAVLAARTPGGNHEAE